MNKRIEKKMLARFYYKTYREYREKIEKPWKEYERLLKKPISEKEMTKEEKEDKRLWDEIFG